MKPLFAITGTVFFSIFLVSMIVYGGDAARKCALISALLAGMSQYVAQDDHDFAPLMSRTLAYAAMAMGIVSLLN